MAIPQRMVIDRITLLQSSCFRRNGTLHTKLSLDTLYTYVIQMLIIIPRVTTKTTYFLKVDQHQKVDWHQKKKKKYLDSKHLKLCRPYGVSHNYSISLLQLKSRQGQDVDKWAWPYAKNSHYKISQWAGFDPRAIVCKLLFQTKTEFKCTIHIVN